MKLQAIIKIISLIFLGASLWLLPEGTSFAGEKVYFYHNDHQGSPIAMTDTDGNVVWMRDYKPFGEEIDPGGETASNTHKYTGKEFDQKTGLYYFGARYYDPTIGRFISVDPAGTDPNNPQSWNRYIYTQNNPYKYIDPDGRVLQLVGTAAERNTLLGNLSKITGAKMSTDFHGIVSGDFSSPSKYSEIEGWMKEIIKSERKVNLQFGGCKTGAGCFSEKNSEGFATLDSEMKDPNQTQYMYRGPGQGLLDVFGSPYPYTPEGVVSHELLGHGLYFVRDKRDKQGNLINDQETAIDRANKVRDALGISPRTGE